MVEIDFQGRFPPQLNRAAVRKLVATALQAAGFRQTAALSVSLVDDKAIQRLNRQYRGLDKPTDVLSFGYEKEVPMAVKGKKTRQLGDIVISMDAVRRQAKAYRRRVSEELARLIVHGLLHLLGHDHDTSTKESRMFALQQDILMEAGII